MPRPAGSPPSFASDTNYTNSTGRDWQGTATKVEPSSGEKAQGWTPGRKIVAQWLNWLFASFAAWLTYFSEVITTDHELVYPAAKTRTVYLAAIGGASSQRYLVAGSATAIAGHDEAWLPDTQVLTGPPDTISNTGGLRTPSPSLDYIRPLDEALRTGLVITSIGARVTPGASEATEAERMSLAVIKREHSTGGITAVATTVYADNSTSEHLVATATIAEAVTLSTHSYYAIVRSSVNAASGGDRLHAFRLTYTDPGPRNYW